jgi:hypothetical protein
VIRTHEQLPQTVHSQYVPSGHVAGSTGSQTGVVGSHVQMPSGVQTHDEPRGQLSGMRGLHGST